MLKIVPSLIRVSEPALRPRVISHHPLGADMARGVGNLSIFLISISFFSIASQAQNSQRDPSAWHLSGSISGSLRTARGAPVANARIELLDGGSGQMKDSTYTNPNGSFTLMTIADGTYEVVAVSGLNEARERLQVRGDLAMLSLVMREPEVAASHAGNRATVSVAQMKVPEKARKLLEKAQSALDRRKIEVADHFVREALQIDPDFAEALTMRGLMDLDAKRLDDAATVLEKSIQADRSYAMGFIVLGAVYNMQSRFDDATRVLDRGLTLMPQSWQGMFELGKAELAKGNYEAAIRRLNKASDLATRQYPPLHLAKAHALLGMKNFSEATSELEAYLEQDPKSPNAAEVRESLDQVRAFVASSK
jgi:tetratricopeptide (TPR) repeat protein